MDRTRRITLFIALFIATVLTGVWATTPPEVRAAGEPALVEWPTGPVLDQGDAPACVGYALADFMMAGPLPYQPDSMPAALAFYAGAQVRDAWADEGPHDGSDLVGGFRFLTDYGWVDSVISTSDPIVMESFIQTQGPIVMGTAWTFPMSFPDQYGVVFTGGFITGYHAYLCYGYDRIAQEFLCQNSWGTGWADGGRFRITQDGMTGLMTNSHSEYKEAWLPHKSVMRWQHNQDTGW